MVRLFGESCVGCKQGGGWGRPGNWQTHSSTLVSREENYDDFFLEYTIGESTIGRRLRRVSVVVTTSPAARVSIRLCLHSTAASSTRSTVREEPSNPKFAKSAV